MTSNYAKIERAAAAVVAVAAALTTLYRRYSMAAYDPTKFPPKPTGSRFQDLQGHRYGRLTVVTFIGTRNNKSYWLCRCACGTWRAVLANNMRRGIIVSCGCLNREKAVASHLRHGHSGRSATSPEYNSWLGMIARCCNENSAAYKNYGGRGIAVCKRWRDDFAAFLADMGPKPSKEHTIDRKNNDGNYEPENCQWATRTQQARNRRTSRSATLNGERKPLVEWAAILQIPYTTLIARFNRGEWP